MSADDDVDGSLHFRPDPWKVALEATQDVPSPSCEVKRAAERLVRYELLQQATGWLLLTQIGLLLGSFGPLMTVDVCLLSWAVFLLEAMLKFARNWVHRRFFMDVPCVYVPFHQEAAHDTLTSLERCLLAGTLLELALYVPYIVVVLKYVITNLGQDCHHCQQGENLLIYLLVVCLATTICHGVSSLVTVWTFDSAMGVGIRALLRPRRERGRLKQGSSGHGSFPQPCRCNKKGCKGAQSFRSRRSPSDREFDRVLCLTWWVHMARHGHLSAVVASAQSGNCGIPGHWFLTVKDLKRIVRDCVVTGGGDHVLSSAGPLGVSQEMGLRALVSLAKQGRAEICGEILKEKGFDLLVKVVLEGKFSTCRGLAAAAIGILAEHHEDIRKGGAHLADAVIPLTRLARSKEHELKEVAYGALLNTALNDDQFVDVLSRLNKSDGFVGESQRTFMSTLVNQTHWGPTTRCQELAIGLLARCAGDSTQARVALMDHDRPGPSGMEILIALLQDGSTTKIKVSAAGLLSELAFKEGKAIGRGPHGKSCIQALIQVLAGEPEIAYESVRALCNLAIKFDENKTRIISAGGVRRFVDLLPNNNAQCWEQKQAKAARVVQEQVQAEAARALWILAYNNSERQELIANADAIPLLVDLLLENPHSKVYIQAVAALSGLAWRNKSNQDLIGREGSRIFPKLVQILAHIEQRNMEEDVLESVMDDKNMEKEVQKSGMDDKNMEKELQENDIDDKCMDEKVLEKVALAISSFADGNKSNQQELVNLGALVQLQKIAKKENAYKDKALLKVKQAIKRLMANSDE